MPAGARTGPANLDPSPSFVSLTSGQRPASEGARAAGVRPVSAPHRPFRPGAQAWRAGLERAAEPAAGSSASPQRETADVLDLIPNPLILPVGILVGIMVAAPVGPVNILCIQRAIERGATAGIFAGLGAVLGDGLIALLSALGVGQITGAIGRYRDLVQIVGGLVLAGFGVMLFRSAPRLVAERSAGPQWTSLGEMLWDVPKTFLLTVTNPGAVLGLVAIFGGVSSFVGVESTVQALWLVAAIIGGSLIWWMLLATMAGRIRHRVTEARLARINRLAGLALVLFGLVLIGELAIALLWRMVQVRLAG